MVSSTKIVTEVLSFFVTPLQPETDILYCLISLGQVDAVTNADAVFPSSAPPLRAPNALRTYLSLAFASNGALVRHPLSVFHPAWKQGNYMFQWIYI